MDRRSDTVQRTAISSLPPDHFPFRGSANDRAPTLDAVGRFNGDHLDASWVDGEVVVEGWLIKISVDGAKVGEIGSATGEGIPAPASRRLVRHAAQRSNKSGNDGDLYGLRHIPIPAFEMDELGVSLDTNAIYLGSPRHFWRIVQKAQLRRRE